MLAQEKKIRRAKRMIRARPVGISDVENHQPRLRVALILKLLRHCLNMRVSVLMRMISLCCMLLWQMVMLMLGVTWSNWRVNLRLSCLITVRINRSYVMLIYYVTLEI